MAPFWYLGMAPFDGNTIPISVSYLGIISLYLDDSVDH